MTTLNWLGLAALTLVLGAGIGGALGMVAIGAPDELATAVLGFTGGLAGGLLGPQVPLKAQTP